MSMSVKRKRVENPIYPSPTRIRDFEMTSNRKLEKNSELNVEREINVVVEQNPSVKKTKLMQIKRTVAKSIIKKVFLILFVSIFLFSCEKDGKDLSEKFCVNLVRNNWNWSCDKGFFSSTKLILLFISLFFKYFF